MMNKLFGDNMAATAFSLLLHLALVVLVVVGMDSSAPKKLKAPKRIDIVKATAMDESQVLAEMAKLQVLEDKKHKVEQDRQNKVDQQLKAAQKKAQQEKDKIKKLEQQHKLEDKKRRKAEQDRKVAEDKKRQADKDRKVAEDKRQAAAEELRDAENKKRLAEADRQAAEDRKRQADKDSKIAEDKKRKAEQDRKDAEARQKKAEQAERQAEFQRALEAEASAEENARVATEVEVWAYGRIEPRVRRYWNEPQQTEGLSCLVSISLLPDGNVRNVKIVEPSGNDLFDRSVEAAAYKAAPFPLPQDPKVAAAFKQFSFQFNSKKR